MYTICMLCVSLCRCDLFVKLITNGRREVKNSLNRKKRVSHVPGNCNEIWIALHLSFPGSYSVERFPEQGFNNNIRQLKHNQQPFALIDIQEAALMSFARVGEPAAKECLSVHTSLDPQFGVCFKRNRSTSHLNILCLPNLYSFSVSKLQMYTLITTNCF